MDISSISGTALMMRVEQTRQTVSTTMIKQAADQQNQMAEMLALSAQQAPLTNNARSGGFGFSTYA